MKQPAKIDVAVLMLFFNRPDNFQKVFDEVKKARPAQLFLYQDGARGERDVPGIEACRQIASDENIDWECEVHRSYQTKNQDAIHLSISHRNGLSRLWISVSCWKMTMCLRNLSSLSARRCSTAMSTMNVLP